MTEIPPPDRHDCVWRDRWREAIQHVEVFKQRAEAAVVTARRDALLEAADDWQRHPSGFRFEEWLRARASTDPVHQVSGD